MENRIKSPQRTSAMSNTFQPSIRGSVLQNLTNNFHRSFISTSKSKNSPGRTSKSKIKTLPNYEKYSMGNCLPFITVFQTIEIERLSDEIETQRVKIKEYERQIFNSSNYEIQIKELIDKCRAYEEEVGEYRDQLQKMNKICETLYHENEALKSRRQSNDGSAKNKLEQEARKNKDLAEEVQKWKQKYRKSEDNKEKQMQQIKELMDRQRKSMLEREMKDLEIRHQGECANLSIEIKRLNQLLSMKEKEHADMKEKYKNSQDYIVELKQYGNKLSEYEDKICMLSQQHLKLSQIVDLNSNELDEARKKQFKLCQQLQSDKQLIFDNQHLREYLELKEKQLQNCQSIISELEKENAESKMLKMLYEELQCKFDNSQNQVQRFSRLIKDRSSDTEKYKELIKQLETTNEGLRGAEEMAIELEGRNISLKADNDRLNNLVKLKQSQAEEWKIKCVSNSSEQQNASKLERQKKNIEDKYKAQVERNQQLRSYIEQIESQMKASKSSQSKTIELTLNHEGLLKENERLKLKIKEYEAELKASKECQSELSRQSMQMRESSHEILQYEHKMNALSEQVSRLTELLKQKNEEIVKLEDEKILTLSATQQIRHLQDELSDKEILCKTAKEELGQFQRKIQMQERQMAEAQEDNKNALKEVQSRESNVREQLRIKTKEFDEMKQHYMKLKQNLTEVQELQRLCQKQQNRITVYLQDLEDLKLSNKNYQSSLESERFRNKELANELARLKQNIGVSSNVLQSQHKISESKKSMGSNQSGGSSIDPQKLITKISHVESRISDLKEKYNSLLKQVNETSRESITVSNGSSFVDD